MNKYPETTHLSHSTWCHLVRERALPVQTTTMQLRDAQLLLVQQATQGQTVTVSTAIDALILFVCLDMFKGWGYIEIRFVFPQREFLV